MFFILSVSISSHESPALQKTMQAVFRFLFLLFSGARFAGTRRAGELPAAKGAARMGMTDSVTENLNASRLTHTPKARSEFTDFLLHSKIDKRPAALL